jgi:hypothetical protein
MKNLLYRIGGYDPSIVKAGRLGAKYTLPGLSLMIVLITSTYGGYHLADTITDGWYRIPFTLGFVSLILLVDYFLLQGEKSKWTALMRVILSVAMGFIISLLTCLVAFESDISSKNFRDIDADITTETTTRKEDIAYWKTLPDSITKYSNLAVKAHKGDYVTEQGTKVGKCKNLDQSNCPKGTYCRYFQDKAEYFREIYDKNKSLINDTTYIANAQQKANAKNSDGIIEQIKDLWALMMDETVVLIGVILFFIFLMVVDLMPISVKFGIKDTLDRNYEEFLKTLRTEKDENGNLRFHDTAKEELYLENERKRMAIECKKTKVFAEANRKQAVVEKLEEAKKQYALAKLQNVIDIINAWSAAQQTHKIKEG